MVKACTRKWKDEADYTVEEIAAMTKATHKRWRDAMRKRRSYAVKQQNPELWNQQRDKMQRKHQRLKSRMETDVAFAEKRKAVLRRRSVSARSPMIVGEKALTSKLVSVMQHTTIKRNKKGRQHGEPWWTRETLLELMKKTDFFVVNEHIKFPLYHTNGHSCTTTVDRIDDDVGYTEFNVELRPHFLNTAHHFTKADLANLTREALNPIPSEQWVQIESMLMYDRNISLRKGPLKAMYQRARNALFRKRWFVNEGQSKLTNEMLLFLLELFVDQGGRCAYSGVPMLVAGQTCARSVSVERLDSTRPYVDGNVVLICLALNARPAGRYSHPSLTEEQRQEELRLGSFDQSIWDEAMGITPEVWAVMQNMRDRDRERMRVIAPDVETMQARIPTWVVKRARVNDEDAVKSRDQS